jgi:hypothetical protein
VRNGQNFFLSFFLFGIGMERLIVLGAVINNTAVNTVYTFFLCHTHTKHFQNLLQYLQAVGNMFLFIMIFMFVRQIVKR